MVTTECVSHPRVIAERFEVERLLGRGAMGEVYAALDRETQRLVALKILQPPHRGGPPARHLKSEFRALMRLSHPGLVGVHDFGETPDGRAYYTSDLALGSDLLGASRTCRGEGEGDRYERMGAFASLVAWVGELANVLCYIHDAGLVHHDVKPQNVMVTKDGVKLIDFGLASERRVRRQMRSGSLGYMAPEVIGGHDIDLRADLYSLGATLYEATTGQLPFDGDASTIRRGHLEETPPSLHSLNAEIPVALERVIERLLAKDPAERYRSAAEMAEALGCATRAASSSRLALSFGTGFHGRRASLETLLAHVRRAETGAGPTAALVVGEAGIGKTSLLQRLRQNAQLRGLQVVGATALLDRLDALKNPHPAALNDAVGELHRNAPAGLVLVCDDVDRLTPDQGATLALLARRTLVGGGASRVALVLTASRPADASEPVRQMIRELEARFGRDEMRLVLEPLPERSVHRMVASAMGVPAKARTLHRRVVGPLSERLYEQIGGNPLWISEALGAWLRQGAGRPNRAVFGEGLRSVVAALRERLRDASPLAHRVVAVLVAHGAPCPLELAAELCGDETESFADAVTALERRRVLIARVEGDGQALVFAHGVFGAAAQNEVGADRLLDAHDALAMHFRARRGPLWRIAHHGLRGRNPVRHGALALGAARLLRGGAELAKAARLATEGLAVLPSAAWRPRAALLKELGTIAQQQGDALAAAESYRAAEAALASRPAPRLRIELELGRAQIDRHAGRLAEARRHAARAARAAGRIGAHIVRARALISLALSAQAAGRLSRAHRLLVSATRRTQPRSRAGLAVSAQLQHALGCTHERAGEVDEAHECYRKAVGLAARARQPLDVARALADLAATSAKRGDTQRSRRLSRLAVRRARTAGSLPLVGAVLFRSAAAALREGRTSASARLYRMAREAYHVVRDRRREARAQKNEAYLDMKHGRLASALRGFQEALALAEACDELALGIEAQIGLAETSCLAGDLEGAAHRIEQVKPGLEHVEVAIRAEALEVEALILEERGRRDDAARLGAEALALRNAHPPVLFGVEAALEHARRLAALGDVDGARAVVRVCAGQVRTTLRATRLRARMRYVAGRIRQSAGEPARAVQRYLGGLSLLGTDPECGWQLHYHLSRAYAEVGEQRFAEAHRARAVTTLRQMQAALPAELSERFGRRRELQMLLTLPADPDPTARGTPDAAGLPIGLAEALLQLTRLIASERSEDVLLPLIMDAAVALTGAERGFLVLRGARNRMDFKVGRDINHLDLRRNAKISRSIAHDVMQRGVALQIDDALHQPEYSSRRSVVDLGISSVLCVPLTLRGEVLGVVYLDHRSQVGAFGDGKLRAAEALANQAAVAIENARLFEENRQHRQRLEESQRALEETLLRRDRQIVEYQRTLSLHHGRREKWSDIVGSSKATLRLVGELERAAANHLTVLLTGETGVGKGLCARAIHENSARAKRPFVSHNCASVPEQLLDAELFGSTRGAYTGADRDRSGLFVAAHGGTLFLDEVGDMSAAMQVKLLTTLDDGEIRAVGSMRPRKVDVRIIAATNKDLERDLAEGRFRPDLYHRLNLLRIEVPPLRERTDDLALLAAHFLAQIATRMDRSVMHLTPEALALLERARWPGNIRQLRHELERAATLVEGDTIEADHLGPALSGSGGAIAPGRDIVLDQEALDREQMHAERRVLLLALERCGQNRTRTAKLLGISRFGLQKRLKRCGIAKKS